MKFSMHPLSANSQKTRKGFTLVEVLIVVIVVAILATITVVAYGGITKRAKEASLKSDLRSAVSQLEQDQEASGFFPLSSTLANQGQGLKTSRGNTFQYNQTPYGYCLTASTTAPIPMYAVRSTTNQIAVGNCTPVVTTLAGTGAFAFLDGPGATAQFQSPTAIAVDSSDTAYVTDIGGYGSRIREITSAGVVSTLAGSATNGFANGTGSAAQFNYPRGIAVDNATGNVYVADSGNHRIRMITPAGVVSTYAGTGVGGFADGAAATAQFNWPNGVAIDESGTLYVADSGSNRRIRVISPDKVVTTLAGSGTSGSLDGTGATAQFGCFNGNPAVDTEGNVYVADACNETIRKITAAGVVSTLAGSTSGYVDATGTAAKFSNPSNLAVDSVGMLYVTEIDGGKVRKVTPSGVVTTTSSGFYYWPYGIAINSAGALIIADSEHYVVKKITL